MERYYCPRCGTRLDVMWQTTMQGAMLLHKVENMAQICCNGCSSNVDVAGNFHTPEDALKGIGNNPGMVQENPGKNHGTGGGKCRTTLTWS